MGLLGVRPFAAFKTNDLARLHDVIIIITVAGEGNISYYYGVSNREEKGWYSQSRA